MCRRTWLFPFSVLALIAAGPRARGAPVRFVLNVLNAFISFIRSYSFFAFKFVHQPHPRKRTNEKRIRPPGGVRPALAGGRQPYPLRGTTRKRGHKGSGYPELCGDPALPVLADSPQQTM
jgi:hypothetical protein